MGARSHGKKCLLRPHDPSYRLALKETLTVKPMNLFFLPNNYLSILFVGLSVDAAIGLQTIADML